MPLKEEEKAISSVLTAIQAIRNGKMVVMVDDENRENEGDLVFAAELATPEMINFMAKEARGLICLTLAPEIVDRLQLPMMSQSGTKIGTGTAFTVSIEAREGVTTGISAADRCHTVLTAIRDDASPTDLTVPGHIFPLRARKGGILERAGHTEGSVDIAQMAGLKGAGVICEIMNEDGSMARMPDLIQFARKHDLPIVTIDDLITFRLLKDSLVEKLMEREVKIGGRTFQAHLFRSLVDGSKHLALTKGDTFENHVVDVRVHSQQQIIDVFGDRTNRTGSRLGYGLDFLANYDRSIFLYLTHINGQESFESQLEMLSDGPTKSASELMPPPMDARINGIGSQILRWLGVRKLNIHTFSPKALKGLSGFGLEVEDVIVMNPENNL
jgi:3,4-dihydroxy 2-butanone 4-phosphate synthase/GTP cyclohydrolase II